MSEFFISRYSFDIYYSKKLLLNEAEYKDNMKNSADLGGR